MKVTKSQWDKYQKKLSAISEKATSEMKSWIKSQGGYTNIEFEDAINYAYALATKYGEASASLSALMYDSLADKSKANVPPAEVASTATIGEVSKTIYGASSFSQNDDYIAGTVGRMAKQAGADTTLKNAKRDGAEFAWISSGDSCAYCELLSSFGWQNASANTIKGNHAEHIHSNCTCQFMIRFDKSTSVEGYNPDPDLYKNTPGNTLEEKANNLRREENNEPKKITYPDKSSEKPFEFTKANDAISKFEEKSRKGNMENEKGIITRPDGSVWQESKGRGNRVSLDTPGEAGYFFSHTHPFDATFSVNDVKGFETSGFKQMRAAAPNQTYILEAINPVQIKDYELRLFTNAMADEWEKLEKYEELKKKEIRTKAMEIQDKEQRSKYYTTELNKFIAENEKKRNEWLAENAPKYGYRFTIEKQ